MGRSRGGLATKIHLRADGQGRPIALLLSAGQRHDTTAFVPLLQNGRVKRAGCGRPRSRPVRVEADKGRVTRVSGGDATDLSMGSVQPSLPVAISVQTRASTAQSRERNRVERLVNRFKQFCRVATHYEKRCVNYLAMVTPAAVTMWL